MFFKVDDYHPYVILNISIIPKRNFATIRSYPLFSFHLIKNPYPSLTSWKKPLSSTLGHIGYIITGDN